MKGGEYIVKIITLVTSIVSLCTSIVGLINAMVLYKKLMIEEKEKNPQSPGTIEDSE